MTIESTIQSLSPGDLIHLFILDLSPMGVNLMVRFTNNTLPDGSKVSFGGSAYDFIPVKSEGWEYKGKGQFPRPKVLVANTTGFITTLLAQHGDLIGARMTRLRTYRQFLDGQPNADGEAYLPPDIFRVEQKTKHTKHEVEFTLAAASDQQGVTLPRRKIFRDTCTHTYRRPNGNGGFTYEKVTCPYAGTDYFDRNGEATTQSQDECGRRLSDCRLRFGKEPLPTRAFPGIVRYTVN